MVFSLLWFGVMVSFRVVVLSFGNVKEMQWSTFYVVAGRVGGGCVGVLSIAGKI